MGNSVTYCETGHSRKLCVLPVSSFPVLFGLLFTLCFNMIVLTL